MKVETIHVGLLQTNCYVGYNEQTKEAFVVDPGDTSRRILDFINKNSLKVTHILLTHSHFDHIMALSDVQTATGAAVCIHEEDADNIELPNAEETKTLRLPRIHIKPVKIDIRLKDGDTLTLCGEPVTVLHTPGHSKGSVCYDNGSVLISGDTLFAQGCGRTDLPGGSFDELYSSLRRLGLLEGERIVYPGHGPSTKLSYERALNGDMIRAMREV